MLTLQDASDPSNPYVEMVTVILTDLGGSTEMVFQQAGHLPDDELPRAQESWSIFFDGEQVAQA